MGKVEVFFHPSPNICNVIQGAEICFSMQQSLLSTEALATLFVLLLRDGVPMYQQPCKLSKYDQHCWGWWNRQMCFPGWVPCCFGQVTKTIILEEVTLATPRIFCLILATSLAHPSSIFSFFGKVNYIQTCQLRTGNFCTCNFSTRQERPALIVRHCKTRTKSRNYIWWIVILCDPSEYMN